MIFYSYKPPYISLRRTCDNLSISTGFFHITVYINVHVVFRHRSRGFAQLLPCFMQNERATAHSCTLIVNLIRVPDMPNIFRYSQFRYSGSYQASRPCNPSDNSWYVIWKCHLSFPMLTLWLSSSRATQ